jgi:glycosyltransferase involved in cell wall biosynthesis
MPIGSRTTVFIMSYNRPETLKEALDSLLHQSLLPDDIVILDNCSSPGNLKKIISISEGRATLVTSDINKGSTWNTNRAIAYSGDKYYNKYIYIMHDDDRVLPKFIETMTRLLDEHPDASAAYPNGYTMNSNGVRNGTVGTQEDDGFEVLANEKDVSLSYARGNSIPFPFVVYRNECLQKIALDFNLGLLNDIGYICRVAEKGPIIHHHARLSEYRIHSNQESKEIDEGLLDRRDDFLIGLVADDAYYLHHVERNLGIRKTERILRSVLSNHLMGNGLDWVYVQTLYKKRRIGLRYVPRVVLWMLKRRVMS